MEKRLIVPFILFATLLAGNRVTCQTQFLLVHGAFHGAWCWFEVQTLLQEAGYPTTALDMTSAGRDKTIADDVTTVAQYAKPLTDFLSTVSGQVVLVGHSVGGYTTSYAMEQYPTKICKAIFLTAFRPLSGQTLLTTVPLDLIPSVGRTTPNFANGPTNPPTSLALNLTAAPADFYNESPAPDITLALTVLVNNPYSILVLPITLTPERYGSVPSYFIRTGKDKVIPPAAQTYILNQNPVLEVFELPNSDHSAFFSESVLTTALFIKISTL